MTQKNTEVIVIGAGYAGLLATVRLAGKTRRDNVNITLVNASDVFVERLRLHQVAANRDIAVSQDGQVSWVTRKDAAKLVALMKDYFTSRHFGFES